LDDEESIRLLLRISLTHKGYEVTTAGDGEKGACHSPYGYKDGGYGRYRGLEKYMGSAVVLQNCFSAL